MVVYLTADELKALRQLVVEDALAPLYSPTCRNPISEDLREDILEKLWDAMPFDPPERRGMVN
jgi:hypothetical protein